jgi:hypothetical protein
LQELTIRWQADDAFTPAITHSVDGGITWNEVISGEVLTGSNGELKTKTYIVQRPGKRHRIRVSGTPMRLHSLMFRFSYAGDERSY